jgi:hypothetical protein
MAGGATTPSTEGITPSLASIGGFGTEEEQNRSSEFGGSSESE